jgi:hypothetical protein
MSGWALIRPELGRSKIVALREVFEQRRLEYSTYPSNQPSGVPDCNAIFGTRLRLSEVAVSNIHQSV